MGGISLTGYDQVNDFSESLLCEASTEKTLHKIVNGINHVTPVKRTTLLEGVCQA